MDSDFMALSVHLLHGGVVGVLVGDEEGGLDVTAIGVLSFAIEDLFVKSDIVVVDCVIEGDGDHLRNVFRRQIARDGGAILRAETVGQCTHRRVAGWGSVRIVVHI